MCDADLGAARERVPFFPLLPPFGVKKGSAEESFCGGGSDCFLLSSRVGNERSYK
jgi:hypothetical protein